MILGILLIAAGAALLPAAVYLVVTAFTRRADYPAYPHGGKGSGTTDPLKNAFPTERITVAVERLALKAPANTDGSEN